MKNDTDSDGQDPIAQARPGNSESAPRTSRRRFGKAGLAAPVIMTLASRPVWAQGRQCSASAIASMNPSRPVDMTTCSACSPGYWHKEVCWPANYSVDREFYVQFGYDISVYRTEKEIKTVVADGHPTYEEIVTELEKPLRDFFPGNGGNELSKAMRSMLAAMLNADHPNVPFALTRFDVLSKFEALFPPPPLGNLAEPTASNQQLLALHEELDDQWNNKSDECILPGHGNCPPPP